MQYIRHDISSEAEFRATEEFNAHNYKTVLHNSFVARIEALHIELEQARGDKVIECQAVIKEIYRLLAQLHEKTPKEVKPEYEKTPTPRPR